MNIKEIHGIPTPPEGWRLMRKGETPGYKKFWSPSGNSWQTTDAEASPKYIYAVPIPAFPAPPEGEEWHNPEGFSAEIVQVGQGYRLRLKSEIARGLGGETYAASLQKWVVRPVLQSWTYRTREPLPKPVDPRQVKVEAMLAEATALLQELRK